MTETHRIHIEPGIYRNRKTGNLYYFTGVTNKHSETTETMVEYFALYDDCEKWSRPISILLEEKEPGNPQSTRFEFLVSVPEEYRNIFPKGKFVNRDNRGELYNVISVEYDDTWNLVVDKIVIKAKCRNHMYSVRFSQLINYHRSA